MMSLNKVGAPLGDIAGVHAMTDVTGFGLAGHGLEMARATGVELIVDGADLADPRSSGSRRLPCDRVHPGRNTSKFASYGQDLTLDGASDFVRDLVCDPQTSGGLLLSVAPDSAAEVEQVLQAEGLPSSPIGEVVAGEPGKLRVR